MTKLEILKAEVSKADKTNHDLQKEVDEGLRCRQFGSKMIRYYAKLIQMKLLPDKFHLLKFYQDNLSDTYTFEKFVKKVIRIAEFKTNSANKEEVEAIEFIQDHSVQAEFNV